MNELNRQLISMYAKQVRVPTFNQYEEVIRQLEGNKSFDDFLVSLMRLTYRSFVLNMNSDRPYRAEFAAQSDHPIRD